MANPDEIIDTLSLQFNKSLNLSPSKPILATTSGIVEQPLYLSKLIQKIEAFLLANKNIQTPQATQAALIELSKIKYYFFQPDKIIFDGSSLTEVIRQYEAQLLQVQFALEDHANNTLGKHHFTLAECEKIIRGFSQLARDYKDHLAYQKIYQGTKFQRAGIGFPQGNKLSRKNPIKEISKCNIRNLIRQLGRLTPPEKVLFDFLITYAPWQIQHATNRFYPIANQGLFTSYTELKRYNPNYDSPFSTPGNVRKLGNDGFVFFRYFVQGVNGNNSRFGETKIIAPADLLYENGWVSLHDQLIPLSSASSKRMFLNDKFLLRKVETIDLNQRKTNTKNAMTGLKYSYRQIPLPSNLKQSKKDTYAILKNTPITRTVNFMEEIFYGPQIRMGIALSVLLELRYLQPCGYQYYFFACLHQAYTFEQKVFLIGNLVKDLFRIEGKYPSALNLSYNTNCNALNLYNNKKMTCAIVINPNGDNRYQHDSTLKPYSGLYAYLAEKIDSLNADLKILQKQNGRGLIDEDEIAHKQTEIAETIEHLEEIKEEKNRIVSFFENDYEIDKEIIEQKIDFYFLIDKLLESIDRCDISVDLMDQSYEFIAFLASADGEEIRELLQAGIAFSEIAEMTVAQLRFIADLELSNTEHAIDLITEYVSLKELTRYSRYENAMIDFFNSCHPKRAFDELGLSFQEIILRIAKSDDHLFCLTCDDLYNLIYEQQNPLAVSDIMLEYARNENIDLDEIISQCDSYTQILWQNRLGGNSRDSDNEVEKDFEVFGYRP